MTKTLIQEVISLTNAGWRPYGIAPLPPHPVYDKLQCPHADPKGRKKPFWFVRGEMFVCVTCSRKCSLSKPVGFVMPLPIPYEEKQKKPHSLSAWELVRTKASLRVDEAAFCLSISERTVRDWIDMSKLVRLKDPPIRVTSESVMERMLDTDE